VSYVVLARKWRPERFSEVVGQRHVVLTLAAAVRGDRIAHAYLFAGPRGVGKTTVARLLAKALNCEKGPTDEPCGECSSCVEIARGKNLDVIEIDGASNRRIEDARGIRETVQYAPLAGRMKVYIIDEAHMLTREAFNALLKTLEEPPAHVVFVLATTEPNKIPDTIASRCQRFDFHRIAQAEIEARLAEIAVAEGLEVDEAALGLVAARAEGSMRDAESLLDQLISLGEKRVGVDDVTRVLGIPDTEVFFGITDAVAAHNAADALRALEAALDAGFDPGDLIDGLVEHLRELLLAASARGPGSGEDGTSGDHEASTGIAAADLVRLMKIGVDAQSTARWSTQPALVAELAVARMASLSGTVELERLIDALRSEAGGGHAGGRGTPLRKRAARAPGGASPAAQEVRDETTASPPAEPRDGPTGCAERWSSVIERIRENKPALAAFLGDTVPSELGGGRVALHVPNGSSFHREQLQDRGNLKLMERAASDVLGCPVKLDLTFGASPRAEAAGQSSEATTTLSDETVRRVLEVFEGEVRGRRREE